MNCHRAHIWAVFISPVFFALTVGCTNGLQSTLTSTSIQAPTPVLSSSIIPVNRVTTWKPGVTYNGGIPQRTVIYRTLSPSGGDDTAAIQAAMNGCPANQVVFLNPGVFRITGNGLNFTTSNCTLRGSGLSPAGATGGNLNAEMSGNLSLSNLQRSNGGTYLLKADRATNPNYGVLYVGVFNLSGTSTNLAADAVKGTQVLTLASNPGIQIGEYVLIDINTDNHPDVVWGPSFGPPGDGSRRWFSRQDRSINQIMKVTAVNGNTLTFETPFHMTFPLAYQAQLTRFASPLASGIGVEDIGVMGGMGGDWHGNISMQGCASCWIKHIEAYWNVGTSVGLYGTYRSEVRDSYIHESAYPMPGGAGYLLGLNYGASDNLAENNIMWNGNKVDVMRGTGGGNVLGYNYTDDSWGFTYPQSPEAGINAGHFTTPHFELLEGNYSPNFKGDTYWGNSIYITVFRNWLSGLRAAHSSLSSYVFTQGNCTYPYMDITGREAVDVQAYSYYHNFVGNVLGIQGQVLLNYPSALQTSCYNGTEDGFQFENLGGSSSFQNPVIMWQIGSYQASVNSTGSWSWVNDTYTTQLRQGNWDWQTRSQSWLGLGGTQTIPFGASQTVPNSLYLTSKPAFFGTNQWPWVDPSTGATYTLPAKARFDAGTPNVVP